VKLQVGASARPKLGESVCGDAIVVRETDDGALFGVIDALGHGPAAAQAAAVATGHLQGVDPALDIEEVVQGLDRALRGTRGAAALIGQVRDARLRMCGVGNVDLRLWSVRLAARQTPGVLGAGVRRLYAFGGDLPPLARLVLFSDGVSGRFSAEETRMLDAPAASRAILERHGRVTDDASVLVVEARIA
jgi:negative regulator of sigma-B (phosphoserine phosphatase)